VGQGWGTLFALNGYKTMLIDVNEKRLEEAVARVNLHIDFLVDAGLGRDSEKAKNRINTTTSIAEGVCNASFVVESVYESYNAKRVVYKEMDEHAPADTPLASSSSGLLMSRIQAAATHHPERCIVAHPWNPVYLIPLVELCPGRLTSEETTKRTYKFMEEIGRVPIIVRKEVPGFIANRLSAALWREALDLVDKGVASAEDVDKAVSFGPGLRWAIMGPYLTYHLGGGSGGIEYIMRHIGVSKEEWLKTMAKWTRTPDSAVEKAVKGVSEMRLVQEKTYEELESYRDEKLVQLLKIVGS
jgi:3-hydroxypropionate dehydrogenase (NADP+)